MNTIQALSSILRKAQGVINAEDNTHIDIGGECLAIRDEYDRMRKELAAERQRSRLPEELVERVKYAREAINEAHPSEYAALHLVEGSRAIFRDILAAVEEGKE